jgi:cell division transport system permease protein
MAQTSKSAAREENHPMLCPLSALPLYFFILGLVGWLVINANKLGDYFRENVEVRTFLRGDLSPKDSAALYNICFQTLHQQL